MEQVETVRLPYRRKGRRRLTNRDRFDRLLVQIIAPINFLFPSLLLSGIWRLLNYILFAVLTIIALVQVLTFLRRYQSAARRWMARPGERRILSHQTRLRAFGIKLSRRLDHLEATMQGAADFQPATRSSSHDIPKPAQKAESKNRPVSEKSGRADKSRRSPIAFTWLLLLFAIGQTAYLIAFWKFQLPDSSRYPVSFAFGLLWMMVISLFIFTFTLGFVVENWRGLRVMKRTISAPGFGQRLLHRWMNCWQPRIESFETPRNDVKA